MLMADMLEIKILSLSSYEYNSVTATSAFEIYDVSFIVSTKGLY